MNIKDIPVEEWFEQNHLENGLFKAYWSGSEGATLDSEEGEGLRYEGTYKDGKQDGKWTQWYKNGQKEMEETYKDGKLDGKWIGWFEDGQEKSEITYKDGELL